jgi:hypothetical protein
VAPLADQINGAQLPPRSLATDKQSTESLIPLINIAPEKLDVLYIKRSFLFFNAQQKI